MLLKPNDNINANYEKVKQFKKTDISAFTINIVSEEQINIVVNEIMEISLERNKQNYIC